MRLRVLDIVPASNEWELRERNGLRTRERTIAALAVDLTYHEVAGAGAAGDAALAELVRDAFMLLRSGAKVEIDKWLEANSGQGVAVSIVAPRFEAHAVDTSAARATAFVVAIQGVQEFFAEDIVDLRRRAMTGSLGLRSVG